MVLPSLYSMNAANDAHNGAQTKRPNAEHGARAFKKCDIVCFKFHGTYRVAGVTGVKNGNPIVMIWNRGVDAHPRKKELNNWIILDEHEMKNCVYYNNRPCAFLSSHGEWATDAGANE